MVQDMTLLM